MKKTANRSKNIRSRAARVASMILTVIMAVMLVPTHAFAAADETAADISPRSAYTLYNYISLNNGSTYISLNTQPNGIRTSKSADEFHRENGNKRYDLNADEYEIDDYDLSGLVILQNGLRYAEQSVAEEGQPYFTAQLNRVEAVACARFRDSSIIEPRTEAFASLENNEITFHRNWYVTLVTPMIPQKVLTGIRLGDGKNGNGNGLYYGIDYTETAQCIDSRYIPFETKLSAGQYSMADYDFSDLVLSFNGESYVYRPDGPVAGDGEQFHYYTVSFLKMDKLAKSTYGGGYLKEGWPSWPLIKNTKGSGTDGAPYKAGYYHRDYQVTLHIEDAPAAEIIEEPVEEINEVEEAVEETNEVEETVEETNEIEEINEVEENVEETNEVEETVEEINEVEEAVEEINEVEEAVEEINEVEETAEEINEVEETAEEINEVEEAAEETNEVEETVEENNEVEETVEEISEVEEIVEENNEAEETAEEISEVEEIVEENNEVEETVEESNKIEEAVEENNEVEETAEENNEVEETAEETNEVEETVEEVSEIEETVEENNEIEETVEETAEETNEVEETAEEVNEVEETVEEVNEIEETAEENNEVEETVEENNEIEETAEEVSQIEETAEENNEVEEAVEEINEVEETVEETVEENNEIEEIAEEVNEVEETAEETNEVEETAEEINEVEETAEETNEVEETVEEAAEAETPAAEPEKAPTAEASEVNVSIERTKARNTDTQIVSADLPQIEEIEDEVMPLANAPKAGWSLMNLIAVILTALIALGMVLRRTAGIFGFIPAIASVMIFALNENLSGNMIMTNSWTPVMIVILLATTVMAVLTAKKARKQNV